MARRPNNYQLEIERETRRQQKEAEARREEIFLETLTPEGMKKILFNLILEIE